MDDAARESLVAAWWEHHRLSTGNRHERKALADGEPSSVVTAYAEVEEMVSDGRDGVVQFLADLNDAGPADDHGARVGAGPLEDLLNQHGDSVIDEIETLARRSRSFREALKGVWFSPGTLTPETEDILRRWVTFI